MDNLFAYGSLMCSDIMQEVSGCCLPCLPGTLKGYSRWCVKGEHYPALVMDAERSVNGIVYRDVFDSVWQRLDGFEGEMYSRQLVDIEVNDGSTLSAETYIVKPEFINYVEESEWDFDEFLRSGKASFQKLYKGYRSI